LALIGSVARSRGREKSGKNRSKTAILKMAFLYRLEIRYVADSKGLARFSNRDLYRLEMAFLQSN